VGSASSTAETGNAGSIRRLRPEGVPLAKWAGKLWAGGRLKPSGAGPVKASGGNTAQVPPSAQVDVRMSPSTDAKRGRAYQGQVEGGSSAAGGPNGWVLQDSPTSSGKG